MQRGVELPDPADQHHRSHRGLIGHHVGAVVGDVADRGTDGGRGGKVDVVHPDAVPDQHRVLGEATEFLRAERHEVGEHDMRAVEDVPDVARAIPMPIARAFGVRQLALERVVGDRRVGNRHHQPGGRPTRRSGQGRVSHLPLHFDGDIVRGDLRSALEQII